LPSDYYANYPGQLFIPLDRYVLGANITYGVDSQDKTVDPPMHYILQQNDTLLDWWDKDPSMSNIVLLRTEQYDSLDKT
jgi:hypothetical protein